MADGNSLFVLNAYGNYGIAITQGDTEEERERALEAKLRQAADLMAKVPHHQWGIKKGSADQTLLLAQGRWALDHHEPIAPEALAIFAGVTERRVRNLMAGEERIFRPVDGKIAAADALHWLSGKKTWRPSTWRYQEHTYQFDDRPAEYEDEVVFVPVAKDGTFFNPKLEREGKFTVGDGKTEQTLGTFREALAVLQKMRRATWPRPNSLGTWSLVSAVSWERKTISDIERA